MSVGILALVLALGAAGWLLWRAARSPKGGETRNVTLLKGVAFLVLAAVLFAAKLMPIAFMTLVAAGAVTAIEIWRERAIKAEAAAASAPPKSVMQADEAASILGVPTDASPEAVRAAHKKLIGQLHPDKGGTDYLAAKINDAREVLIAKNAPTGSSEP
ncbi:MAG TPA: DnaJ domain-containing protein [Parvularculaceae bacterium]|nr:DnaJ domain-containing protein [Parvularculaceae bacterium]